MTAMTAAAAHADVTIRLEAPPGIDEDASIYFASNLNGWNPGDEAFRLSPVRTETKRLVWELQLPRATIEKASRVEFKFTRGDWGSVEIDEEGRDVSNRVLPPLDEIDESIVAFSVARFRSGESAPARRSTVTGTLVIQSFTSDAIGGERTLRIWLPPGYERNEDRRYPVLYMHDAQNVFDAATSTVGKEWEADETATRLIEAREIPPMIIVAVDHGGVNRAREYNPQYTTFNGLRNYGDRHVRMLVDEIVPFINTVYRTKTGPEHTALGGSSFGGNSTLHTVMSRPGVFGAILVESPASLIDDGKLVDAVEKFNQWPRRVFVGMGTKETGDAEYNDALVRLTERYREIFEAAGLGDDRLKIVIEEGAVHDEGAWARRLPDAMRFLFSAD
ncbi:MAG: alpha/beta hydrolase-fold protein [Phycisphaerales bacterium]